MRLIIESIASISPPTERTAEFGRYRVTMTADGAEHVLSYRIELRPELQSVSWEPSRSILSDTGIDVLVVAKVTDTIVAFHRGESVQLPRAVTPLFPRAGNGGHPPPQVGSQ